MAERIVTGLKEIDQALKQLERKAANRIVRAGLRKGARLAAKQIKAKVPSRYKNIRKSVGFTVRKAKGGPSKGITEAKAGFGVGTASQRAKSIPLSPRARGKKPGVGISAQNVHWWVLGTDDRYTKKKKPIKYRGSMPAQKGIPQSAINVGGLKRAIREGSRKAYVREMHKAAKITGRRFGGRS